METLLVKDFLNGETLDIEKLSRLLAVLKHQSGIYIFENILNGKKYIGSSKTLGIRVLKHLKDLFKNRHHNIIFQRTANKYSLSIFELHLLEAENYEYLETLFLSYLNKDEISINRNYSGGDIISNHPNRNEIIEKQSAVSKKIWEDPSLRNKKSIEMMGTNNPNYKDGSSYPRCKWPKRNCTKEKNSFYGKKHTKETKQNLKDFWDNYPISKKELKSFKTMYSRKYFVIVDNICFFSPKYVYEYLNIHHRKFLKMFSKSPIDNIWYPIDEKPNDYPAREYKSSDLETEEP